MKATNSLHYTKSVNNNKLNCEIDIRLSCEFESNYHEDFAITGTFWKVKKPRIDSQVITTGCCHKEILKHFPELKQFVDLHLSDAEGAPMYALEDGLYHLKQSDTEVFKNHLRLTTEETKELSKAESQAHLYIMLKDHNIIERWSREAKKAIAWLESKTGEVFKSNAIRSNLNKPSAGLIAQERIRVDSGYYAKESKKKRQEREKIVEIKKAIKEIKKRANKEISKVQRESSIKIEIAKHLGGFDNFIYYSHSNELKFNWLDYGGKLTEAEFRKLKKVLDIPKDVKITLSNT